MKLLRGQKIEDSSSPVKAFYRTNPFPYFDVKEYATFDDLKRRASGYVRRLDQCVGSRARILEVGCGTGQLSNYLAHIPTRMVVGMDFSPASLALANKLRHQLGFDNLYFLEANLFDPPFVEHRFDLIICHGVLHHTTDPRGGFRVMTRLLKPDGCVAIGLYHRLGRRKHRKQVKKFQKTGEFNRSYSGYRRLSEEYIRKDVSQSWFADQYLHPRESGHLLTETVSWFEENGLDVTGSVPSLSQPLSERPFFSSKGLTKWRKNRIAYLLTDLRWWLKPFENGYFVVFGRNIRAAHYASRL